MERCDRNDRPRSIYLVSNILFDLEHFHLVFWRLIRQQIDMAAADLSITYARSQVVDFTVAFSYEPMAIMTRFPTIGNTITRIIKPFQPQARKRRLTLS